ncbi:MAG: anhydro-N-acetylmuramic acid kinase [Piscirickettsiaceae bacterium]|nr:MAG: anhydro-N-acetylmuramic acid kinase [Piscirickettsiaceae bacterium]
MHSSLYIGLMSGTSLDGVDIVLVNLATKQPVLLAKHLEPYPEQLLASIKELCRRQNTSFDKLGVLDAKLGDFFADAIVRFASTNNIQPDDINAIGSHGQTIQHQPFGSTPYTLQIGDAHRIVEIAGITVVADFRRRDMAAGGQGAPLVPAFHQAYFSHSEENRVIINIGGIANITYLPMDKKDAVVGFDSGPGNTLMDQYCQQHFEQHFDTDAELSRAGNINKTLLNSMLGDKYFALGYPKSTGPEYFSLEWLQEHLTKHPTNPTDMLATLCELTAVSIKNSLGLLPSSDKVFICGGGTHNPYLMEKLRHHIDCPVETTQIIGIDPDWVEAIAFAWLAKQTLEGRTSNIPSVTGANKSVILGAIYPHSGYPH